MQMYVTLSQGCLVALLGMMDPMPGGKKLRARQICFMRISNPLASFYSLDKMYVTRSTHETL